MKQIIFALPEGIKEVYSNKYEFERNEEEGRTTLFYVCESEEELEELEEYVATLERDGKRMYDPDDFFVCEFCGDIVDGESFSTNDYDKVCEDCLYDNYSLCERCEEYHRNDSIVHIEDTNEYWCDECADNYAYQCEDCGGWVRNNYYVTADSRYICESCREENYVYCYGCDELIHINDVELINDEYYCSCCASELSPLRSYHHNPATVFNEIEGETTDKYIGCEIETEQGDFDERCEITAEYGNDESFIYQMKDGSLNEDGIECITQPMSKKFFDQFDFEGWFKELRGAGARSHNTENCGLHIHLSRTWFGNDQEEQERIAGVCIMLMGTMQEELKKFARRSCECWCEYEKDYKASSLNEFKEKTKRKNSCRYRALNTATSTGKTYEFRIFRGTLNPETFRASVDLCIRLVEYAKYIDKRNNYKSISWDNFLKFKKLPTRLANVINRLVH
jgi:hypothetical protein